MFGFFLNRRKKPFHPPEDWQVVQVDKGLLTINRALEDWQRRFDFSVLCRITLAYPGSGPGTGPGTGLGADPEAGSESGPGPVEVENRLEELGPESGRGLVAAVRASRTSCQFLFYTVSTGEAATLRKALLKSFPGLGFTVERDTFWQVYRELLPL